MLRIFLISAAFVAFSTALSAQTTLGETITINAVASQVHISGNTEICKGGETTLKVEGEYESFEWSNGTHDRYLHVREEGVYEVTVRTKGGCSFTGSVNVRIRPCL
jgi:hypothetical protein